MPSAIFTFLKKMVGRNGGVSKTDAQPIVI